MRELIISNSLSCIFGDKFEIFQKYVADGDRLKNKGNEKKIRYMYSKEFSVKTLCHQIVKFTLLCGLTIDSIVQNFFFPEALTKKSKTNAYMGHLL